MPLSSFHDRFGGDPLEVIRANLQDIREKIRQACLNADRSPDSVRLLPVSKTVPVEILRAVAEAGLIHQFGENKVQEADSKAEALNDLPVQWSVIGHLQSNKAKQVARFASEFQALDSLKVAELLDRHLTAAGRTLEVLVQVNTSGEETKFGLQPEDAAAFIQQLPRFPNLRVKGLMTLALFSPEIDKVRRCFQVLTTLQRELRPTLPKGIDLDELSMGMSGDYETAIQEGATIVRVGQAIFGPRPGSDAHYWPGLIPESPL